MDSLPPKRRRKKTSTSSAAGGQLPRKKKKGTKGKKRKKPKNSIPLIAMIGIPVAAVLLIAGLYFLVDGSSFGSKGPYIIHIEKMTVLVEKETDVLKTIHDQASAEAAADKLKEIYIERSIIDSDFLAYLKKHEDEKLSDSELMEQFKRNSSQRVSVFIRKDKEDERIRKIPGLQTIMSEILRDARKAGREARAERYKKRKLEEKKAKGETE